MKTLLLGALMVTSIELHAGPNGGSGPVSGSVLGGNSTTYGVAQQHAAYEQQEYQRQVQAGITAVQQAELNKIYSKDPWRLINGSTNLARGYGWLEFQGVIMESRPDGVVFRGHYGPVLTLPYEKTRVAGATSIATGETSVNHQKVQTQSSASVNYQVENDPDADIFFVANFPYSSRLSAAYQEMMAFDDGYYTYTNNLQEVVTVHKLNYGTPCVKIWSQDELTAEQRKQEAKKQAAQDKILKSNQDAAERGDTYGLLRMGERYRDGEGVTKDLTKARTYLSKAADAGSVTAAEDLSKLSQISDNSK